MSNKPCVKYHLNRKNNNQTHLWCSPECIIVFVIISDQIFLLYAGRDTPVKVSSKHAVNGNPTIPPFPDTMQLAMFGK